MGADCRPAPPLVQRRAVLECSVTKQAPLVIECLRRARPRQAPARAAAAFLPRGILESESAALERWSLDASAAAAAPRRARWAYPALD